MYRACGGSHDGLKQDSILPDGVNVVEIATDIVVIWTLLKISCNKFVCCTYCCVNNV